MNKNEFDERKMLAKQHFQPTLEEYQKEFNQEFLKEIEFPDYVGYYFRDYYNILEIQLKQKESQIGKSL